MEADAPVGSISGARQNARDLAPEKHSIGDGFSSHKVVGRGLSH